MFSNEYWICLCVIFYTSNSKYVVIWEGEMAIELLNLKCIFF